ncbi:MAG: alpha/beta fold hydrolase [Janibacter sp.]
MTTVREEILRGARTRTIRANGLRHRVLTFGVGAQDLVLVPGITSPAETVEFLSDALPEFTVHVPDLRGRGLTDRAVAGEYTTGHYRQDLAEILPVLDLTDPVVVGHSLGARIVAAWALAGHAARTRMVLVDPPLSGPGRPYPMPATSFARQLAEAREGTTAEAVRAYFPDWPERELRLRAEVLAECDETAVLESHAGFEEEDFLPTWDRLRGRIALIHGSRSPVVTTADIEELTRRNPHIPIVGVADAGHMVPWDNLPGFVRALRQLLAADADHHHTRERYLP